MGITEKSVIVDPARLSIIHNKLVSITEEMGYVMLRTSRSPLLSEGRDFTTGIFDDQSRLVAATEYIPIQAGAAGFGVKKVREFFGDDGISNGDVFVLNDPYWGGNHLLDITVMAPVFNDGKLRFWVANRGQHADVGGAVSGGYYTKATEIFQEGFRLPPLRFRTAKGDQKDIWNLLVTNSRAPKNMYNDLRAQLGSLILGSRRLEELVERYGQETLFVYINTLIDSTEKFMRQEIAKIPDGVYRGESKIEDNGIDLDKPIRIAVEIKKESESISFDYAGSDKQTKGIINSPFANTASATFIALFTSLSSSLPHNEGSIGPVRIRAPEGCVVNPLPPAAHQLDTLTTTEVIVEACWKALSQAIPEKVPAAWARQASAVSDTTDRRTGNKNFLIHGFLAKGGAGAMMGLDGLNFLGSVASCGGGRMPSIELVEAQMPYTVVQHELRPDSGGAGMWRGGLGIIYKIRIDTGKVLLSKYGDGMKIPPFGLLGGKPGYPSQHWLIRRGRRKKLASKEIYQLNQGDVVEFLSGGGGGIGNPRKREREKVRQDLVNGLISLRAAKEIYGYRS
jgi:N-methylhydantoinase B